MGGVATWLDYLLPGLEAKGWEPTLGLASGRFHDPDRYLEQHPFHRVIRIDNPTGSQEGRVRSLGRAVQKVNPAAVLSVNIPDIYLALARLRSQGRSAAKSVMTLHGIQADLLGDAYAFREILDAVVCTNKHTCQLVEESAGISPERIYYAPYGVDTGRLCKQPRPQLANRPVRIAWAGRMDDEQKRTSDLPRILRALDELGEAFELWIAGAGPEEANLRVQLAPWMGEGRVKMFGVLSREGMYEEIHEKADVFLLTSSWETGPIVIWEAMSVGLPVVTSDYLGLGSEGSLVHGENCLIYPVGDASAAARAIATLRNPEVHGALTAGGLKLVRHRYSTQASVDTWSAVLEVIVHGAPSTSRSKTFEIETRGRLDRWLGVGAAETIRGVLHIRHVQNSPGSEWPHSLSGGVSLGVHMR